MKYNKFYNILYSLIAIITGFSIGLFVYGLLFITAQYDYVIVPQIKTARAESLSASCSVTTTSVDTAVWTAVSSGGTGSVTYSWSGTDGLTDSTSITTKTYTTSGVKTGTVTVTSGGSSSSATCSIVITIPVPPTPPQCSDGIDNDGDSLVDFPSDPGCSSASDTDETDIPVPPTPPTPPTPPQCSDGIDNDSDGLVDEDDYACHTDGDVGNTSSYDSTIDDENSIPIILLVGSSTISLTTGDSFTDHGATADDKEDGDITASIISGGDAISTTTPSGTYTITYNVTDSKGASAVEVVRTVVITDPSPTPPTPPQCSDGIDNDGDSLVDFPSDPGCSSASDTDETDIPVPPTPPTPPTLSGGGDGGGGGGGVGSGGGGGTPIRLEISNEKVERISTSTALVTFETNLQANGQVLYDTSSYASSTLPFTEYVSSTIKTDLLLTKHSVEISELNPNTTYYFRPIAFRSIEEKGGIELVLKLGDEVKKTEEIIASKICSDYILEPIKFGEDNSIVEVLKLQTFLNDYEDFDLDITGVYDLPTYEAVKTFQSRYAEDILTPWGLEENTGYVYITTMKKINDIYCEKFISFSLEDVSEEERVEIEEFNALLESLHTEGILNIDTSSVGSIDFNEEDSDVDSELASGPVFEDTDRIIEIFPESDTGLVINILEKDEGVVKKIKNFFNNINITDFLGTLFYFTF